MLQASPLFSPALLLLPYAVDQRYAPTHRWCVTLRLYVSHVDQIPDPGADYSSHYDDAAASSTCNRYNTVSSDSRSDGSSDG